MAALVGLASALTPAPFSMLYYETFLKRICDERAGQQEAVLEAVRQFLGTGKQKAHRAGCMAVARSQMVVPIVTWPADTLVQQEVC